MKLSNGVTIPSVGFGTWLTPEGEVCVNSVKTALDCGYRHIDTASIYKNEVSVGQAISESSLSREEIFLTSKVWNSDRGYQSTLNAFEASLKRLNTPYLDLYLIHWPASSSRFDNWDEINLQTWQALTELYQAGKIKAIGVSNFKPHHLASLMETSVPPMVNQIEFHPGMTQQETCEFCQSNGILVEAWSPLGRGKLLGDPVVVALAEKYQKTTAQICLRWCLQHQVLPLPKSVTASRISENLKVENFEIAAEDMSLLDSMANVGGSGLDPDKVEF